MALEPARIPSPRAGRAGVLGDRCARGEPAPDFERAVTSGPEALAAWYDRGGRVPRTGCSLAGVPRVVEHAPALEAAGRADVVSGVARQLLGRDLLSATIGLELLGRSGASVTSEELMATLAFASACDDAALADTAELQWLWGTPEERIAAARQRRMALLAEARARSSDPRAAAAWLRAQRRTLPWWWPRDPAHIVADTLEAGWLSQAAALFDQQAELQTSGP